LFIVSPYIHFWKKCGKTLEKVQVQQMWQKYTFRKSASATDVAKPWKK